MFKDVYVKMCRRANFKIVLKIEKFIIFDGKSKPLTQFYKYIKLILVVTFIL